MFLLALRVKQSKPLNIDQFENSYYMYKYWAVTIDYTFVYWQNVIGKELLKLNQILRLLEMKWIEYHNDCSLSLCVSVLCIFADRRNVAIESSPLLLGSRDVVQECFTAVLTVAVSIKTIRGKRSIKVKLSKNIYFKNNIKLRFLWNILAVSQR